MPASVKEELNQHYHYLSLNQMAVEPMGRKQKNISMTLITGIILEDFLSGFQ